MSDEKDPAVLTSLQRLLKDRWKRLDKSLAKVMEDPAAEPVHTLRITTRRLQELLELAASVLKKSPHGNTLRALKQARKGCDAVRNLDVLQTLLAPKAEGKAEAELWIPLLEHLRTKRTREAAKMKRQLERLDLPAIHARWSAALKKWPNEDLLAEHRLRGHLIDHLTKRHVQFLRSRDVALAVTADIRETHNLRLAGKRLRYALEALADLGDEAASGALARLKAFQQALGQWHDLEMVAELLIEHVGRKKFLRRQAPEALELVKHLTKVRDAQAKKLAKALDLTKDLETIDDVLTDGFLHPPEAERAAA